MIKHAICFYGLNVHFQMIYRPLFTLQTGTGRIDTHFTVKREIIRIFETLTVLLIYT